MAYTKPQQREKGDRLTGEGDMIRFIDHGYERRQVAVFGKRRRQVVNQNNKQWVPL